jgi:glycosyltransferase involved in cell wall biosynthesis
VKIAVYTIALNEEKHVARWHASAKDADLLLIADTGSTDKTKFIAKSLGITVHEIAVTPWRFDVARNASLALVPEDFDVCIQLDMDETLQPGWRQKVEAAFLVGNNWPIYKEVNSRSSDGKPKSYWHHFRIHPRKGFFWKYPIHEVLIPQPGVVFKRELIDLEVDHIQDQTKPRNSYLDLLETAVKEEPNDWRMRHYLNREYWYKKDWNKVLSSAYEAMEISNGWDVERASTCMWASEAAHQLNLKKISIEWADLGIREAPNFYEAWHWRAHLAHLHGDWHRCRESSFKRLELKKQDHHLVKPDVWEWWGYDLMALSSHKLNFHDDAVKYGKLAVKSAPQIERLRKNLYFYLCGNNSEKAHNSRALNINDPIAILYDNSIRVLDQFYLPFTKWDYMSENMLNHGLWDLELTNWLIQNVKQGWKCINVGSNSGYFLEILSRLVGIKGKVTGFEPNTELVNRYLESRKLNDYSDCADIDLHALAIGREKGEAPLSIPTKNLGGAFISHDLSKSLTGFEYPKSETKQIRVSVSPLSEFEFGQVDLILMDVEGSEEDVFASFDSTLRQTPIVIIETGSYHSIKFLEFLFKEYTIQNMMGSNLSISQITEMPSAQTLNVVLRKK